MKNITAALLILTLIIAICGFIQTGMQPVRASSMVADEYISDFERKQDEFSGTFYMSGPEESRGIALTFDDGPSPRNTPQILDILDEYDVPGTFFLLGQEVEEHPWLVESIAREGHEIGNHSYTHRNFTTLDWAEVKENEIGRTGELIEDITGEYPRLIRPPYGDISDRQLELFSSESYQIVNWSVDVGDYELENQPELLLARAQLQLHGGAIVLMHDGGGDRSSTIEFLPELIKMLEDEGFNFKTVSEIIEQHQRPTVEAD